jgi:hypothetical protein
MSSIQNTEWKNNGPWRDRELAPNTVRLPRCDCCGALVPIPERLIENELAARPSCIVRGYQNKTPSDGDRVKPLMNQKARASTVEI